MLSAVCDNIRLKVLRQLDKADRMTPFDVYQLLTTGRMDKSGAFTEGCGLDQWQALMLIAFTFMVKEPVISDRIFFVLENWDRLEEIIPKEWLLPPINTSVPKEVSLSDTNNESRI